MEISTIKDSKGRSIPMKVFIYDEKIPAVLKDCKIISDNAFIYARLFEFAGDLFKFAVASMANTQTIIKGKIYDVDLNHIKELDAVYNYPDLFNRTCGQAYEYAHGAKVSPKSFSACIYHISSISEPILQRMKQIN